MIRDIYALLRSEEVVGYINVDSLSVTLNWDYNGELPEKLFITGKKDDIITSEKLVNYLKYKTHTNNLIDCLEVLESLKQDTKDGFKLIPRPKEVYSQSKVESLKEKAFRKHQKLNISDTDYGEVIAPQR